MPTEAMIDDLRLLHAPLGVPGSGRVRYGAAMAFFRAGRISEAQLEAYREASAHDARDPAALLAERGLPPVPLPIDSPADVLSALVEASEEYLRGLLVHPGAEDVRMGLAGRKGPPKLPAPRSNPVADRWLAPAIDDLASTHPSLAGAIAAAAPHLDWITYDLYPRDEIGEAFPKGHAFARLVGEGATFAASGVELGLFVMAPHLVYRDHNHAAPELYAPLTGPHDWRFGPGSPLVSKPAHEPVWNPPFRPHLTRTGRVPFLAFYVWTRDINEPARVIHADDWAALEASAQ